MENILGPLRLTCAEERQNNFSFVSWKREREEEEVGVEAAEVRDGEEINEIKSELPGDVEKAEKDCVQSTAR